MAENMAGMDAQRWSLVDEWMSKGMMRNAFIAAHGTACAPGAQVLVRGAAYRPGVKVDQVWWCNGCGDVMPAAFNIMPKQRQGMD